VRRRVALKVIKLGMDTKSVIARFEAERQALALMDHPNIAKVFDGGATEAGRPYFVMELVRGLKITDYCDEKKLSTRERLDLFMQVCQAIQHAHQKGIIHRDIKPSNVLVTVNDGVPVPKVIDFGIAKATSGLQLTDKTVFTAFEQFIGTPAYMSPEQAVMTSLDIDTRSDIYALGVLLYELLTGRTPFDTEELLAIGLDEMRRTIREKEPSRPSARLSTMQDNELSTTAQRRGLDAPKLVSELRGDLDWIVMKALEKDRSRRYETANGLALDIQRHLNYEPVLARPPSAMYRLQKLVRRNKMVFASGTAVVTALLIGFGVSTWMYFRERSARREQVRLRELAEANEKKAQLEAARSRASEFFGDMARYMSSDQNYKSDNKYADIDNMLKNILTPEGANQALNAPILDVRAFFSGRRGRLREAAADYSKLIEFDPEDPHPYFMLAPLLLANRDEVGYRKVCKLMLARFGSTKATDPADLVTKTCCLLPPLEADLPQIDQLAALAIARDRSADVVNSLPWNHLTMCLNEYRQGRYADALEWGNKSLNEKCRFSDDRRYFSAHMVLAMAHYRLGQMDEARADFAKGVAIAQTTLPDLKSDDLGPEWENLLHNYILMREAKALIEGGKQTRAETK
jgi:eukaryotic-like serine/threonine-protein kinase